MKKLLALALCLAIVALPAVSNAKKGRTESGEYNTVVINPDEESPSVRGSVQQRRRRSRHARASAHVEVVLEDSLGFPARAVVGQDLDGDGATDVDHEVCGATEAPIKFRKMIDITVTAQEGPCDDGTNAVSTFGTITVTFTR